MTDTPKRKRNPFGGQRGKNMKKNLDAMVGDAFVSTVTGAGVLGQDKFTSYYFQSEEKLHWETLASLYRDNDIAATIVERVVLDALRSGYMLDWKDATDEKVREVQDWAENEYNLTGETKEARIYARLFGGGAVFMGVEGVPEKPIMDGREVKFLRAVPSHELTSFRWFADPLDQKFGQVSQYHLQQTVYQLPRENDEDAEKFITVLVDESRFVEMYGILTTQRDFEECQGWGKSVLHRVYDQLKKFEAAYDSILHTLAENSIPVYKVEGLLDMLASANADLLQSRFQLIHAGKSNYRAIVLGENESFERVEARLAEAANVVDSAMVRVAGASGMPVTVLFGRAPAGLNATGESDLQLWHQQVHKEQTLVLGPAIRDVYKVLLSQTDSPLNGQVPEDLSVKWPPIWTPSLQDEINQFAQRAQGDATYIQNKVLLPEEVAVARAMEGGQFPHIDLEFRKETLEMREEQMLNPPQIPQPGEEPQGEDEESGEAGDDEASGAAAGGAGQPGSE